MFRNGSETLTFFQEVLMVAGVSTSAVSSFVSGAGTAVRGAQGAEEAREGARSNPAEERAENSQGGQQALQAQASSSGIGTNVNISV